MGDSSIRNRGWVFTVFVPEGTAEDFVRHVSCITDRGQYWSAQLERCPKSSKLHVQGFVYFKNPRVLAGLKKLHATAHFESMRGTVDQAIAYTKKDDTRVAGPKEGGERPQQGKRTDIDSAIAAVQAGTAMREVALANPVTYVRYFRGLHALSGILAVRRNWLTTGVVYWGPPGTYKTTHAREMAGPDAYWLLQSNLGSGKTVWMENYEGQEDIVIDEFYGWLPLTFFLNLLDQIPMTVQTKGGSTQIRAKRIWITSNANPTTWYASVAEQMVSAKAALARRLCPPVTNVFFVGYGPNMDLETCPCQDPDCKLAHPDPPGPSAFAPGFQPSNAVIGAIMARRAKNSKNASTR